MMYRDDPLEKLAFMRPEFSPGIEILAAENSFEPWHVYHEQYAVCACRMAATGIRYRGDVQPIGDESACFFEPGEFHRNTKVYKRSDFRVLFIKPKVLEEVALQTRGRRSPHFHIMPAGQRRHFEAVYAYCRAVESGAERLEQECLLAACLRQFMDSAENAHVTPVRVERSPIVRAQRYLVENYNRAVSLDELCLACGVSKFHLARAFAQKVGMPPHAFQIHVRIERARQLLRKGLLPVEVAMVVGFADQSHLTRHFRRIWRVTPGAYARLH